MFVVIARLNPRHSGRKQGEIDGIFRRRPFGPLVTLAFGGRVRVGRRVDRFGNRNGAVQRAARPPEG